MSAIENIENIEAHIMDLSEIVSDLIIRIFKIEKLLKNLTTEFDENIEISITINFYREVKTSI